MERVIVHYSGRVQGVGFRATARHIACGYEVTGMVRNLPDGPRRTRRRGYETGTEVVP